MKHFTIRVRVIGKRRALVRAWFGCWLLGIASAIIGSPIDITSEADPAS